MTFDDPKLTAYVLDELSPADRVAVEADIGQSPELQREVEEIRQFTVSLTARLKAEPCPQLTAVQREQVLHNNFIPTPATTTKIVALPRRQFWAYTGAVAVAACLAAMLLLPQLKLPEKESRVTTPAMVGNQHASSSPAMVSNASPLASIQDYRQSPNLLPVQSNLATNPDPAIFSVAQPVITNLPATIPETNMAKPNVPNTEVTMNNNAVSVGSQAVQLPPKLVPLLIPLPIPAFMGTPTDIPLSNRIEKPSDKPRPVLLVPKGVTNVAFGKKVTSSDKAPLSGSLDLVTDGDKESSDTSYVELHRKTQWVQIDLAAEYQVYAIVIWHAHNTPQVYHSVVVQLSDDPDFTQGVHTLFNNDMDNAAGLGVGTDKEYFENYEGKLIQVHGIPAHYLRAYSRGSSYSALNRYTEIEVYALPMATASEAK